jgi:hypothetical protein
MHALRARRLLVLLAIIVCIHAFFGITVLSVCMLIFGTYITACNWYIVVDYYKNKKTASSVPLLGGLFVCIGLWNLLPYPWHWLSLLGLIIDRGCLPMISVSLFYLITRKYKDEEE